MLAASCPYFLKILERSHSFFNMKVLTTRWLFGWLFFYGRNVFPKSHIRIFNIAHVCPIS